MKILKASADDSAFHEDAVAPRRRLLALLVTAIIVVFFGAIASFFVFHGKANADEGFYAVISHEVMNGKLPYRDLAYTQTPLLPYIQGVAMSVIGFGVAQQRWLNVAIQAASLALALFFWIRRRLSIPLAIGFGIAWSLCLPLLYYGIIGKTYALAQIFLIAASFSVIGRLRPIPALILLSLCGVLAVGCRLPVAPSVVILWLGFCRMHAKNISKTLLVATPLLFALFLLGPFIAAAPDNAYFWMWGLHSQVMIPHHAIKTLMQLPLFAPGMTIVAILGLAGACFRYTQGCFPGLCLMGAGVGGAIVNVLASGIYLEYVVPCLGLIVLGAGEVLALCPLSRRVQYAGAVLCILISSVAFFLQDRHWAPGNYLGDITAAGRYIASRSGPEDQLLTSMPELGLAADRPLYPRSEMGKFSVTAEMDVEKACDRRMISFVELVYITHQSIPKIIALSRFESWDFRWSIPSLNLYRDEDYNLFRIALAKNYNCTFINESFFVFTRKVTAPLPAH